MSEDAAALRLEMTQLRFEIERKEDRIKTLEKDQEQLQLAVFGNNGQGGLINDLRDTRQEHKYLRWIYVLVTMVAMPLITAAVRGLFPNFFKP